MKTWKIAIVGCGWITETAYLPQKDMIPRAEIVALCDLNAERAKSLAERYSVPAYFADMDTMIEKCDFDILINATSIPFHHSINMRALQAKKHLYTEKPIAPTVEEASEQIEAAKAAGVKISAGPIHMLKPEMKSIKNLVQNGSIGTPSLIKCSCSHGGPEYFQFRDADPTWFYRKGAGSLVDIGVHAIDIVTGLLGPVKSVSSIATISEKIRTVRSGAYDGMQIKADETPDNYIISLDFGDGTLGIIDSGFVQKASRIPPLSFEIYGSQGTISNEMNHAQDWPTYEIFRDDFEEGISGWTHPTHIRKPATDFLAITCISDMIDAIENDRPTNLTAEHARHVVEIMCAVSESVETGRTVQLHTTF